MAWTSPRTWVTGEIVTAAMMNEQLRDNLLYLGDPPLNIDSGLLFTDTTNDRVGIGTTTPGSKLHVEANSGVVELRLRAPGDGVNTAIINFYDSTDDTLWHFTRRDGAYAAEKNWFGFYFWDGANWTTAMRLKPDGDVVFSNNVGIGTAYPKNKFHIIGDAIRLERSGAEPFFYFYRPEAVTGYTGGMEFAGLDSENVWTGYSQIRHYVQDTTAGNEGAALVFRTRRAGAYQTDLVVGSWGRVGVRCWPDVEFEIWGTTQLRRVADANATNTLRDSHVLQFQGAYWDGTSSQNITFSIFHDVVSTAPSSMLSFLDPDGSEVLRLTSNYSVLVTPEGGTLIVNDYSLPGDYDFGVTGNMICIKKDATIPTFALRNEATGEYGTLGQIYFSDGVKNLGRIFAEADTTPPEDASIRFAGYWAGASNLAFIFYMDGSGYADVGWYTFSPDLPEEAKAGKPGDFETPGEDRAT